MRPSVARVNSAAVTLQLPIRWPAVLDLALQLPPREAAGRPLIARAIPCRPTGMRVADIESLERCVAAALRGHLVEVHLVAEEALEAAPPEPEREMPAASLEEGWTLRSRGATQLELLMAPGTAVCTRDTELCCWPKVSRVAAPPSTLSLPLPLCPACVRERMGTCAGVGVCPDAGQGRGAQRLAGHGERRLVPQSRPLGGAQPPPRHRGAPAVRPPPCLVRLPQRTPALWRGPTSKSRLKRARAAAAALAAARQPEAAPEDAARAAKAVEAALHKAPRECEAVGVDRAALSGLLRHARGQPN